MKVTCILIDDEPLALEGLKNYVDRIPYLRCLGTFSSPLDVLDRLDELKPDLLFLDIQMPYLTGLELVRNLADPPRVIFTTAYDQYALEGFELDVVDYLLKPVSFERFLKACEKAKKLLINDKEDWFFIKTDKRTEKIKYSDISHIEGLQNYARIFTGDQTHIVHFPLKSLLENLPDTFMQVHKSFIVNLTAIDAVDGNQLVIVSHKIPVSRTKKEEIMERLVNSRLIKR